ncbi:MAG TPA: MarP family serine protease [Intrasporangium sp.]|uniref:MarP family serine protease n=1 Tax=Intrasporangium sp. TaxID=1925024 RepID=UPI002D778B10|nr:MarP family serine protease [Intrasporangium sp.]HET7398022.1 MarP family serine protease [Intrasporangium sp.]
MTGGQATDLLLLVVLGLYALSGYRQGLVASVCSLVGFVAGAVVAIWQLPAVLSRWDAVADDPTLRVVVLVVAVVLVGWLGQFLGALVGGALRRRVGPRLLRRADALLGAVLVTLAAAVILGFLGSSLRGVGNPALTRAASESRVLGVVSELVPEQSSRAFAGFRSFLYSQGFPRVFSGLGPEPITPVAPPDGSVADSSTLQDVERSVVKVTTRARSCSRDQEGTGWVLRPGQVVTNAHVVAGADRVRVESNGQEVPGQVTVFDARRDLAVIAVPGLDAPALPLGSPLPPGASAAVPGYPLDGPYSVVPARVRTTLDARGLDIYGRERVVREIYSLNTTVQPGNSGGPLVDTGGHVVGVVFAKSLEDSQTGYALTLAEARPVLDEARTSDRPVPTGACLPG